MASRRHVSERQSQTGSNICEFAYITGGLVCLLHIRILLILILVLWKKGCELNSSGAGQVPAAGSPEHGNKPSGSIKGGQFLSR